jgi:hypothetical protein
MTRARYLDLFAMNEYARCKLGGSNVSNDALRSAAAAFLRNPCLATELRNVPLQQLGSDCVGQDYKQGCSGS